MINRAHRLAPAGAVKPGELVLGEKGRVQVEQITISADGVGLVGPGIDRAKRSRTKVTAQPSDAVTVVASDAMLDQIETKILDGHFEVQDSNIEVQLEEGGPRWLVALRDGVVDQLATGG